MNKNCNDEKINCKADAMASKVSSQQFQRLFEKFSIASATSTQDCRRATIQKTVNEAVNNISIKFWPEYLTNLTANSCLEIHIISLTIVQHVAVEPFTLKVDQLFEK